MPRRGETKAERRSRLGREGMRVRLVIMGRAGAHAMAANARAGLRRRVARDVAAAAAAAGDPLAPDELERRVDAELRRRRRSYLPGALAAKAGRARERAAASLVADGLPVTPEAIAERSAALHGAEMRERWARRADVAALPGLAAARRAAGLSQRALAARSGVTARTVWRLETGQQRATAPTVARLADALGVEAARLRRAGQPGGRALTPTPAPGRSHPQGA